MSGSALGRRLRPLGLIALCVAAVYSEALVGGRVFYQRDVNTYWYPMAETFVRVVSRGSLPLWDPYEGFGLPLLADPGSQALYPFTWLNLILLPGTFYTAFVVSHSILAGFGAFALGRSWHLSRPAALVAGIVYCTSGPLVSTASLPHHLAGAAWLPWVLAAFELLLATRSYRHCALLGVAGALQVLAGSGDMCVMTAVAMGGRALAFVAEERRNVAPAALRVLLASALAIALSAAQVFPTVARLDATPRGAMEGAANLYWSVHPLSLVDTVVPGGLATLPVGPAGRALLYESREPFLSCLYLGAAAFALAALGGLGSPRRRWLSLLLLTFFVAASLGRHGPVAPFLTRLPVVSWFRYPVKYMIPAALFWALLVGLGVESWNGAWGRAHARRGFLAGVAALGLAAGALGAAAWLHVDRTPFATRLDLIGGGAAVVPLLADLVRAALVSLVVGVLLILRSRREASSRAGMLIVCGLVAADLVLATRGVNGMAPLELLHQRPPVLAQLGPDAAEHRLYTPSVPFNWLNDHLVRGPAGWEKEWSFFLGIQEQLMPPVGARWGLRSSFDPDYTGLSPALQSRLAALVLGHLDGPLGLRLLQLGNVAYIVSPRSDVGTSFPVIASVQSVFSEPITLRRVPDPLPSYYLVGRSLGAGGDDEALARLLDPSFDPRTEVVLSPPDAVPLTAGRPGTARRVTNKPDCIEFEVESRDPTYLVLVEGHDPGWRAKVDGVGTALFRANGLFRAVRVPAGSHRVELRYWPVGLTAGLVGTLLGTGALLFASVSGRWGRSVVASGEEQ